MSRSESKRAPKPPAPLPDEASTSTVDTVVNRDGTCSPVSMNPILGPITGEEYTSIDKNKKKKKKSSSGAGPMGSLSRGQTDTMSSQASSQSTDSYCSPISFKTEGNQDQYAGYTAVDRTKKLPNDGITSSAPSTLTKYSSLNNHETYDSPKSNRPVCHPSVLSLV